MKKKKEKKKKKGNTSLNSLCVGTPAKKKLSDGSERKRRQERGGEGCQRATKKAKKSPKRWGTGKKKTLCAKDHTIVQGKE